MIDIKINLRNVQSGINVQNIANQISEVVKSLTNQRCNIHVNMRDNYSTSPLGIYLTEGYLNVSDKL